MGQAARLKARRRAEADCTISEPARQPGSVVMLSGELGRHVAAQQCLLSLKTPPGTAVEIYAGSVNVPYNRNHIARTFQGDWLLMVDDDQVFASNMLMRLLRHLADPRVDIVVPLILRRGYPHDTVLAGPNLGKIVVSTERGLIPVFGAGTGCMLIRRRVFDRLAQPWFEHNPNIGHDMHFCTKAQTAGCGIFCDVDVPVGHIVTMAVWPARTRDGRIVPTHGPISVGTQAERAEGMAWVSGLAEQDRVTPGTVVRP